MPRLAQSFRHAWRALRTDPWVSAGAITSLALGIGAATAVVALADALLRRPLPYPDPDRLVILWNRSPGLGIAEDWFSTAQFHDIQAGHHGFDALAIAIGANANLTGDGEPERVGVIRGSSGLLPLFGAQPAAGRLFTPGEDAPGRPPAAILSDRLWTRRYGRDPGAIGRPIDLNGTRYEIVGVLPPSFALPRDVLPTLGVAEDGEIFLPLPLGPDAATNRGHEDYNIVGRLARGVSAARAQAEMDGITARLRQDHPDVYPPNGGLTFSIVPLLDQVVGPVRRPLWMLLGAVALVLAIACANVANLLLARAIGRRRDLAVRLALGGTWWQLARQQLAESLGLAVAGGLAGLVAAAAAFRWLHLVRPPGLPRLAEAGGAGEIALIALGLSIVCGLLFGLSPLAAVGRLDVAATLADAARGSSGADAVWARGRSLRRWLVIAELALAVMLLVGAGLLLRSFASLLRVPPGFDPARVLTMEITTTGRRYAAGSAVVQAYRDLWTSLAAVPGVEAVGGVSSLPLSGYFSWGPITVEGRTPPPGEAFLNVDQRIVSGRYFEAMRIPLLRGRWFDDRDTADQPGVIVIDEFMAREIWPGADPVGRRVRFGDANATGPWRTVVGVVGRVKQYALDTDGRIALYLPQPQAPTRALYVVVRTAGAPAAAAGAITSAVRAFDPALPLYHVRTMADRVAESLARQRFALIGLAWFAGIAFMLAVVGVYGVMSYVVGQSTRELGIRLALGATPAAVVAHVLRQGGLVAAAGLGAGLVGAAAGSRLMRSVLFGVGPLDPITFVAVAAGLAAAAMLACYLPARRAGTIDPLVSLTRN